MLRAMYGYDPDALSDETGTECKDPSLTIQEHAIDADINVIVKRFGITGVLPGRSTIPVVTNGDFLDVTEFREVQDILVQADRSFMALPAEVRDRFRNDPALFVEFCSPEADGTWNEDKVREMIKMGLAVERVVPKEVIQKVEIVAGIPPKDDK